VPITPAPITITEALAIRRLLERRERERRERGRFHHAEFPSTAKRPAFSNSGDPSWSAFGFDTGIRNFETGAVTAVPEPETFALMGLGLLALIGERRCRRGGGRDAARMPTNAMANE
jgi:hypothetical protein